MQKRGSSSNPESRFIHTKREMEESDLDPDAVSSPSTELFADKSRTVLSTNDSPDVPFSQSVNPYRG
ncbi:MAG TPA: radical SAM protein, partial [Leptospiraceae bacterium]|nr:radical SAM protein [Leptospiraceae bacterium]